LPIDRTRLEAAITETNRLLYLYSRYTFEDHMSFSGGRTENFGFATRAKHGVIEGTSLYCARRHANDLSNHERILDDQVKTDIMTSMDEAIAALASSPALDHPKLKVSLSFWLHPAKPKFRLEIDGLMISQSPGLMPTQLDRLERAVAKLEQYDAWTKPICWNITMPAHAGRNVFAPTAGAAIIKLAALTDPNFDLANIPLRLHRATASSVLDSDDVTDSLASFATTLIA
jgi:hypothetical protein